MRITLPSTEKISSAALNDPFRTRELTLSQAYNLLRIRAYRASLAALLFVLRPDLCGVACA
jgi:hypothetical protein